MVEQLQNWSQSVHLLVSMPLQCDSAGLPIERRDLSSHVCLWAGPVTCFGQQDAVERPLCQFLLTFTLSLWILPSCHGEQALIVLPDEERWHGKQLSEPSQGHPRTAYIAGLPHIYERAQPNQQSCLPALELTANVWMSTTEIKRTALLTYIVISNNKHSLFYLEWLIILYIVIGNWYK